MNDPNLYRALHSNLNFKSKNTSILPEVVEKNHFELALEKTIKDYVQDLIENEDPVKMNLVSPAVRQSQLIKEVKEDLDMADFGEFIKIAVTTFCDEGQRYLNKHEYNILIGELEKLRHQLETLDLTHLEDGDFKKALEIPTEIREFMLKIGIAKFTEELYPASLSIFSFLSAVDSDDPDYWYRLGLVAQQSERYDLAIRSFEASANLAPDFIGTKIFNAQCLLNLGRREDALAALSGIKDRLLISPDREKWEEHLVEVEKLLSLSG